MAMLPKELQSAALSLVRFANMLLQEEQTILASREDCDYFRNIYRSKCIAAERKLSPSLPPASRIEKTCPLPESLEKPGISQQPLPEKPDHPVSQKVASSPKPPSPQSEAPPIVVAADEPPVPKPAPDAGFADLQKLITKIIPGFPFVSAIPSDAKALQIAQRWKTKNQSAPISLLCLNEPPQQQKFLTNLALALDVTFGPARLIHAEGIEKENQWEAFLSVPELKLVIICDYALWQMPHLLQFYREVPNQMQRFLRDKPLMLLPDLTLYLKDPQLKRSLWKALCQKIGSH